ncbi:MAG TPA: hypothetical protein VIL74_05035 [Pyrinomonadaceae bacterium]|jgi:hypothetical protein
MNSEGTKIFDRPPAGGGLPAPSLTRQSENTDRRIGKTLFLTAAAVAILSVLAAFAFYSYRKNRTAALDFSGNTITVKAGGDFQAALDRAKPGDTIFLEAGATFKGAFKLPKKDGNEFITVRTSAADAALPPEGARLDPRKYGSVLPKLISEAKSEPVLSALNGAHHFRFVGVEFGPTIEGLFDVIRIGNGAEKSVDELPHHIEFDRVWVHGGKKDGQRRGVAANGRHIKIQNSYFSDIMRRGEESQAIAVWATDGPVEIINNYLEGAAENILFGGAGSFLKLVPADCVVRSNHLNKPLEWRSENWVVKNLFEIKNGRRIKVENNLMTNNWAMGQDGTAILFTTRADNGEATIIEEVEFVNNIVRGSANGINVFGGEGSGGHRLTIRNNQFEDIDGKKWGGVGNFMKSTDWDGLAIENNTILQSGSIAIAYGEPVKNFEFRNNIVFENEYGMKGDSTASGQPTIDKFFPAGSFACNLIIGGKSASYKEKNLYVESLGPAAFANPEKGDYRLKRDSAYVSSGCGGKRIGADLDPASVGQSRAEQ